MLIAISLQKVIETGALYLRKNRYFNQEEGDKFLQYAVGIDREWSGAVRSWDTFYLLLQYNNEIKTFSDRALTTSIPDFRRAFNNTIIGRAKYTIDAQKIWAVNLEGTYNFTDRDSYVESAIALRKDRVEVEGGLGIMFGGKRSFWGTYQENKRIFVKMRYAF